MLDSNSLFFLKCWHVTPSTSSILQVNSHFSILLRDYVDFPLHFSFGKAAYLD